MSSKSRTGLFAFLLLVPAAATAQSGTIRYERSLTRTRVPIAADALGGARPGGARGAPAGDRAAAGARAGARLGGGRPGPQGAAREPLQEYAVLTTTFDGMVALTRIEPMEVPPGGEGGADRPAAGGGRFPAGARVQRLQPGPGARGLSGLPVRRTTAVWVDGATGERVETVDFMTRDFRVESVPESLAWRLLGEESEYLGYVVQKAVAERDSSTIEAWFTVDIPGFAAPEQYTGLPGVVLMVSVDRGETLIQAVEVDLESAVETPVRPTEGEEMTAEAFGALVDEKTEEFRAEIQSRRRGGGGGA
jgi:hypothetical protein